MADFTNVIEWFSDDIDSIVGQMQHNKKKEE